MVNLLGSANTTWTPPEKKDWGGKRKGGERDAEAEARLLDAAPAKPRKAVAAPKKLSGLDAYESRANRVPRPVADPLPRLLFVVGSSGFARCAGFHWASCPKCGDAFSGTLEDCLLAGQEHPCGPYDVQPPEGWQDGAADEARALEAERMAPYLIRMKVKPPHTYDSPKYRDFATAIDQVLRENGDVGLVAERKMRLLVGTQVLPGMKKSGSESKPMERYWPAFDTPASYFEDGLKLDLEWYHGSVARYIQSAFGFDSLEVVQQRSLASWF